MKHAFAWLMALALSTPQILTAEGQTMSNEQANVHATVETMTAAFQDNDIASVMAAYEAQATVVFEPDSPVSDMFQIEQMFAGLAMVDPVFTYPVGHEVIVNGDMALHISPWEMTGRTPDGQDIAQSGLSVAVLRRQEEGSWKMIIDNPHGSRLLAKN